MINILYVYTILCGTLVFILSIMLYRTFRRLKIASNDNPMTFRETCNFTHESTVYIYNTSMVSMIFGITIIITTIILYRKKQF